MAASVKPSTSRTWAAASGAWTATATASSRSENCPAVVAQPITLQEYQANLRRQFHKLDRNRDGYLNARELTAPPR